jgi:chitinase
MSCPFRFLFHIRTPAYSVHARHSALSFLMLSGAADKAVEWTQLNASARAAVKAEYASAGISLIVSAFGSTDAPTSSKADPVATANTMASWVKEYGLDGIDVDYEVCRVGEMVGMAAYRPTGLRCF